MPFIVVVGAICAVLAIVVRRHRARPCPRRSRRSHRARASPSSGCHRVRSPPSLCVVGVMLSVTVVGRSTGYDNPADATRSSHRVRARRLDRHDDRNDHQPRRLDGRLRRPGRVHPAGHRQRRTGSAARVVDDVAPGDNGRVRARPARSASSDVDCHRHRRHRPAAVRPRLESRASVDRRRTWSVRRRWPRPRRRTGGGTGRPCVDQLVVMTVLARGGRVRARAPGRRAPPSRAGGRWRSWSATAASRSRARAIAHLGERVDRRRRLVEDQHVGAGETGAQQRDELTFTGRQLIAAFADLGRQAVGQRLDPVAARRVRRRRARRPARVECSTAKRDVGADRVVEQERLLRHDDQPPTQLAAIDPPQRHAAEIDRRRWSGRRIGR